MTNGFTCPICGHWGDDIKKAVRLTFESRNYSIQYRVHPDCAYGMILEQHRNGSIWRQLERDAILKRQEENE